MDFDLSEEYVALSESVYRFSLNEIAPLAERIDREDWFPEELWSKMKQLGFMGLTIPEQYGGAGMDILAGALMGEQIARFSSALALSVGAHAFLCTDSIYRNGNEEQRNRYLPLLAKGDKIGAMALTEPGAGSDATGIKTVALKQGRHYVLTGSKMFITNAPIADVFLVYAKTDPEKGFKGISAFIVQRDFPGLSTSKKLDKMGHRGSPTGEVFFDECLVPVENLLGQENGGIAILMSGLDRERAIIGGLAVGLAEGAFALALKYAKERTQFGQLIGNFQLIQAKVADMYTAIEASRLLVYKSAMLADKADNGGKGSEIHKVAGAAALFAGEMATKVALDAVQIHGGYGYMLEYPVNKFLRDAKLLEIGAGTSEIRRLLIARELLE